MAFPNPEEGAGALQEAPNPHGAAWTTLRHVFVTRWTLLRASLRAIVRQRTRMDSPSVHSTHYTAGALQLAFETAAAHGATLVLANDPDADRLAVAAQGADGTWSVLSGNQIGVLLADWQLSQHKLRCAAAPGVGSKPTAMLSSAVSSRMMSALCAEAGCHWEETLTGFKWLCARGVELRAAGYEVLMSYEEAIGFCLGSTVNDKDGVSAGVAQLSIRLSAWLTLRDHHDILRMAPPTPPHEICVRSLRTHNPTCLAPQLHWQARSLPRWRATLRACTAARWCSSSSTSTRASAVTR